jgi:hypothetical protein
VKTYTELERAIGWREAWRVVYDRAQAQNLMTERLRRRDWEAAKRLCKARHDAEAPVLAQQDPRRKETPRAELSLKCG